MDDAPEVAKHERRHALTELDVATVARLLADAFPEERVTGAALLSGGYSNTNYRVRLAGDGAAERSVVLRLHARADTTAAKEAAIVRRLAAEGRVPVAAVLDADPDGTRHGIPFTVLAWVEGERLDALLDRHRATDAPAVGACAEAAGATLAAIHSVTFPQAGEFGPDLTVAHPFPPGAEGWVAFIRATVAEGRAGARLGPDLARRVLRLADTRAALLDANATGPTLVHCDYKGQNLLVRRAAPPASPMWEVAAVLDWEFALAADPLMDVGNFLRFAHQLPPEYAAGFERGYRAAGGTLPPDWRRLGRLHDLLAQLEFLNLPDERPVLFATARALVERTLRLEDAADNAPPVPR